MKTILKTLILLLAASALATNAAAQRRITPVTPVKTAKKPTFDKSRLAERTDANGNKILVDTVAGTEWVDTTETAVKPKNIYPLLHNITIAADVWDPLMKLLGTHHGGIGFWASLSIHNRFFPTIEAGVSTAKIKPDGMNYTFRSPLAPYFKLGISYNIFYNSNPDYQLLFGVRYGLSPFSYSIEGIRPNDDYWDNPPFDIPESNTTAGYFEFSASLKVRIIKNISLGWSIKYHSVLHGGKTPYGESMYIPGYGKRGTPIAGAFSIMYTIPLNKTTVTAVKKE